MFLSVFNNIQISQKQLRKLKPHVMLSLFWNGGNESLYSQRKLKSALFSAKREKMIISRRNSKKKEKFCSEVSRQNFSVFHGKNGHHDFGIEKVFASFRDETKTVIT